MPGETTVGGLMQKRGESAPALWLPYLAVDDTDAATAKAEELGATVMLDAGRRWRASAATRWSPTRSAPPSGCTRARTLAEAAPRRRPCARSARRRRGSGRSARRASRSGGRGRSPAGACSTVSTPPSTCSSMKSNSARQISSTWLGGAPPFRYGIEVELEVHPVVELEAHRQLPEPRLAAALERRLRATPGRRSAGGTAGSRRSSGSSRRGSRAPRRARASPARDRPRASGSRAAGRRAARARARRVPCRPAPRRALCPLGSMCA